MTTSIVALLAITGTLVLFKLALMALAVALLAKTLLPERKSFVPRPALASLPSRSSGPR